MRLEKLVDAISSNPQVLDSMLLVLREITSLINPKKGSPDQVLPPLVQAKPKREMSTTEQIIPNALIQTTITSIRGYVWSDKTNDFKSSFKSEAYKDDSMQSVAQLISLQSVNTAKGRLYDKDEWVAATERSLKTDSPLKIMVLEILRKALDLRPQ